MQTASAAERLQPLEQALTEAQQTAAAESARAAEAARRMEAAVEAAEQFQSQASAASSHQQVQPVLGIMTRCPLQACKGSTAAV